MSEDELKVRHVGKIINESTHSDNDYIVVIAGREGVGKSTLGTQLNMEVYRQNDKKFSLADTTLFYPTEEDISEKYRPENRYNSYQWDEAIRVLYKLDWANIKSKAIVKDFAVNRAMNIATILCIPRAKDLNENFRNWRVNLWGEVIKRGVCVWFTPDWNMFAPDPWHWEENYKTIKKLQGEKKKLSNFSVDEIVSIIGQCVGYAGYTIFDKLPDEVEIEYKELKETKRTSLIEKVVEKGIRSKEYIKKMAEAGMSNAQIITILKEDPRFVQRATEGITSPAERRLNSCNYNKRKAQENPPISNPIREIRKGE